MNITKSRCSHLLFAILGIFCSSAIHAAEPTLRNLDIRGLKVAGTTTLTIDGDDLGKAPRLLLPFDAKQSLKPGITDKKAAFDVTLGTDVEPGYYQLRVVSEGGVSLPVVVGVDRLPQVAMAPAVSELPAGLHGTVAGASIVETKFQGKAKQKVMIEVEAQRLGSKLRPIVHLYSPKKLQLAWTWGTPALFGDARLEAVLPEDGAYSVTVHDAEYAAVAPSFFRLRIGEWFYVDQVFPPVAEQDRAIAVAFVGRFASPSIEAKIEPTKAPNVVPLRFLRDQIWSGPRPYVSIGSHAEFMHDWTTALQNLPDGRVGVSGILKKPSDEHKYRIPAKSGQKVKLEVFAERLGSPIDVALVIRGDKDVQLARADDSPGTLDPALEYTVPDKVTSIIVGVVDAQGRGGPRGIYRLVIDPQTPGATKDGFNLHTLTQRVSLPVGGRTILPVQVDRRGGYAGKIELSPALPLPSIKLSNASIPEGADGALVTVERDGSLFDAIVTSLRGRTTDAVEQSVAIKNHPLARLQPWLATELALAPSNETASEFAIDWRDLPENADLFPASKLLLPVKVTRPMSKATVKLTLVTSQNTPILNNQPDANKALRQDKLGELAANVNTGDVTLLVPADLSSPTYDVTVQAELLDPAKKVLATAFAPVRRMTVVSPIVLRLDGPNRIEAPFDAKKGTTVKIQGKLERREGFKADVVLALTGLPTGAKADALTVKADATTFSFNVAFPPTIAPGEIKGVKLSGSYAPDGKLPNVRVRSREVEVTLVLQAPIQ